MKFDIALCITTYKLTMSRNWLGYWYDLIFLHDEHVNLRKDVDILCQIIKSYHYDFVSLKLLFNLNAFYGVKNLTNEEKCNDVSNNVLLKTLTTLFIKLVKMSLCAKEATSLMFNINMSNGSTKRVVI